MIDLFTFICTFTFTILIMGSLISNIFRGKGSEDDNREEYKATRTFPFLFLALLVIFIILH